MDERWVRVLSLHMDVSLPIIDFTPDNQIIPIIGDISEGLDNLRLANGELFSDDLGLVVTLLPALLSTFAGGATAGLIEPITLPFLAIDWTCKRGPLGALKTTPSWRSTPSLPHRKKEAVVASVETEVTVLEVNARTAQHFWRLEPRPGGCHPSNSTSKRGIAALMIVRWSSLPGGDEGAPVCFQPN